MQENFDDNSKQSLDSRNQDYQGDEHLGNNEDVGDINQNIDQMGSLNQYPGNINMNQPEMNPNPLENLMFNQNQNVVEEKSNKFLSFLDKYKESFGKYFDVELNDIKLKLKG